MPPSKKDNYKRVPLASCKKGDKVWVVDVWRTIASIDVLGDSIVMRFEENPRDRMYPRFNMCYRKLS